MSSYAGIVLHLLLLLVTAIACASNASTSLVAAAAETTGSDWRSDLNWTELESNLSPSASLIDTSFTDFKECIPEFYEESPTNHALIDQPSGMCLPHLLLGWDAGSWMYQVFTAGLKPLDTVMGFEDNDTTPSPIVGDESSRSLNLPSKVVFPSNASDVRLIVLFAMKNKIELSVKNSGHSYTSSSSKANTLLMNMNQFTKYAQGGITDCAAVSDTAVADDLSNQACLLALARGKPGVIRVGEARTMVYRAVLAENQADAFKYHLVGGAAGTVSPMGWTFQGGNGATMGDRLYGKGVDQVLQVEMVLPNGYHVKFGPTEWEDASAKGFAVPRTKVVSGVCRSNPDEQDEEKWMWGACPEEFDINFGDLWFAVRGGGGGTWGVVTSMTLQLHDYLLFNMFNFAHMPSFGQFSEECSAISLQFELFRAKYFMAPSLLNVTKEKSLACGAPDSAGFLYCYGEHDVMQAWTNFLELNNATDYAACIMNTAEVIGGSLMSYPEAVLMDENARFPGKVLDYPPPAPLGVPPFSSNVLIPQSWIDESEENIDNLVKDLPAPYYAYGVATYSFSDQANSLPQTAREAAVMVGRLSTSDAFWSDFFPKMYDISDKTKFPAVYQSNHAGPSAHGPLKDDWTKVCPTEWTFEERKEKCISPQEAIYGTELLRRLEAIKMKVDPGFIFNCTDCIGNNLDVVKAPEAEVPLDEPSSGAVDEPSGASFASTFATAISATMLHLVLSIWY